MGREKGAWQDKGMGLRETNYYVVGLYPAGLQALYLPILQTEERPRVSDRNVEGLTDCGGAYMSEARSWSDTPACVADSGQVMAAAFAPRGRGRVPVIGRIDVRWAHRLPGKPAEEHTPHCCFDKLAWWRCSDLKIRTITSWFLGQYVGRSVM